MIEPLPTLTDPKHQNTERGQPIMRMSSSVSVPTFCHEQQNTMVVVSSKDLARLKKRDPFSYFSIPEMMNAEFLNDDVDMDTPILNVLSRNEAGGPLTNTKENQTFTLYRKSRVSSECHVNLIFEHMMHLNVSKFSDYDKKDDDDEDMLKAPMILKGNTLRRTSSSNISDDRENIESDEDILNILKMARTKNLTKKSTFGPK